MVPLAPCIHYWLLDSPGGASTVLGRCGRCGDERRFVVAFESEDPLVAYKAPKKHKLGAARSALIRQKRT